MNFGFFLQNALIGIGLAMDAFSVSMANGLNEPCMRRGKLFGIAGMFGLFQGVMPLIGWFCIHNIAELFSVFRGFIPWISLALLAFIGGKMLIEGIGQCKSGECEECHEGLGFGALAVQGIATSIDALSVGFTIADYDWLRAAIASLVIAAITFVICAAGVMIGKKFGTRLAGKASIFGGVILIVIGIEIFISGLLG